MHQIKLLDFWTQRTLASRTEFDGASEQFTKELVLKKKSDGAPDQSYPNDLMGQTNGRLTWRQCGVVWWHTRWSGAC